MREILYTPHSQQWNLSFGIFTRGPAWFLPIQLKVILLCDKMEWPWASFMCSVANFVPAFLRLCEQKVKQSISPTKGRKTTTSKLRSGGEVSAIFTAADVTCEVVLYVQLHGQTDASHRMQPPADTQTHSRKVNKCIFNLHKEQCQKHCRLHVWFQDSLSFQALLPAWEKKNPQEV